MLITTKAIVLGSVRLKENALLLKLYTRELGRCDHVIYGAQSKRGGRKCSFLQPLSVVELTADFRANHDLQVVKDVRTAFPAIDIQANPYKNVVATFLSELLSSLLVTHEKDESLFSFIEISIMRLEITKNGIANFHLAFLCHLPLFLGFYPNLERSEPSRVFDLQSATFVESHFASPDLLSSEESAFLRLLCRMNYDNMPFFHLSRAERQLTLKKILLYYKIHTHGMKELKSLDVLTEIFD